MILDYKNWKKLFEEATAANTGEITEENAEEVIRNTDATPEAIKKALEYFFTYNEQGKPYTTGQAKIMTQILNIAPGLPEAIKKRFRLDKLVQFYEKCGRIRLGIERNPDTRNTETVPVFDNQAIIAQRKGEKDVVFTLKPVEEFTKWLTGVNLTKYSSNEPTKHFNPQGGASITIVVGVTEASRNSGSYKNYGTPIEITNEKTGETRYTYIYASGGFQESTRGLEGTNFGENTEALRKMIIDHFKLNTALPKGKPAKTLKIEMPVLSNFSPDKTETHKIYLYGAGTGLTKAKVIQPEETKTTIENEPDKIEPIEKKYDNLNFGAGKSDPTDSTRAAIEDVIKLIKEKAKGKKNIKIEKLLIRSSASNFWTNKLTPTHSNNGDLLIKDGKYTEDPFPGKTIDDLTEYADKNKKLAWLRGEKFTTELMDKLKNDEEIKALNIQFGEPMIEWRVTDTGGAVDREGSGLNKGQYVFVSIDGATAERVFSKRTLTLPEIKLEYMRQDYVEASIVFQEGPGVARFHPNSRFAALNALFPNNSKRLAAYFGKQRGGAEIEKDLTATTNTATTTPNTATTTNAAAATTKGTVKTVTVGSSNTATK